MGLTLQELAKTLSLSPATVSCILNGKTERFNADTVARVQTTARLLGYRPSRVAQAMRLGKEHPGAYCLLSSDSRSQSYVGAPMLAGIQDRLKDLGRQLTLQRVSAALLADAGQLRELVTDWSTDGLLVAVERNAPQALRDFLRDQGPPHVWLNAVEAGLCARPDDAAAVAAAVDLLRRHGHRSIAYADFFNGLGGPGPRHYSVADRERGYREAMAAADLPARVQGNPEGLIQDDWRSLARAVLQQEPRPTAVVTYSCDTAMHLYVAAVSDCGLRVPDDLSLLSLMDEVHTLPALPIDRFVLPWYAIGRRAVDLLHARVLGGPIEEWRMPDCSHHPAGSVAART